MEARNCSRASVPFRWAETGLRTGTRLRAGLIAALLLVLRAAGLLAQTNTNALDEIPPLRPLRGELPPSFFEQHGVSLLLAGFVLLILLLVAIWLFTLRRPPVVLPPEILARQALEALRSQPEDGALLSRVSQIIHRYLKAAFDLPPVESTTSEFCAEIAGHERVGPELAGAIADFLRRCDERKFSPAPVPELGAVAQALKLVESGEGRRAWLRAAAAQESSASKAPA